MEKDCNDIKCWRCHGFGDYVMPYFDFLICHICKGKGYIKQLINKVE